jgi:hypothetical protein
MSGSLAPQWADSLQRGAIKGPPHLLSPFGYSLELANNLRHYFELQTSLPQAPFKSKLYRRDLSLTLE